MSHTPVVKIIDQVRMKVTVTRCDSKVYRSRHCGSGSL